MPDIRAMCAIGRRGQLGLNGRMPWEGAKGPEYTADVHRFFELTRGQVILLGPQTYRSVPTSRSAYEFVLFCVLKIISQARSGLVARGSGREDRKFNDQQSENQAANQADVAG